ncbi:MAG: hypothetical protein U0Z75_07070 [Deinococcaceae bacterium]
MQVGLGLCHNENGTDEGERLTLMNYAAILAVLMVLSFAFPSLVKLGGNLGFHTSSVFVTGIVLGIFVCAWYAVRRAVVRHRNRMARINNIKARIVETPYDPKMYFDSGEHLGTLLLKVGRRREAKRVFKMYAQIEGTVEPIYWKASKPFAKGHGYPKGAGHESI